MPLCSKEAFMRFGDSFLLAVVFLFQCVTINYLIIHHFRQSSSPFLLFLADFMCLLVFSFTLYLAYRAHCRGKRPSCLRGSTSLNSSRNSSRTGHRSDSEEAWPPTFNCCSKVYKMPFGYVAWIIYSAMVIFKVVLIFKSGIPKSLSSDAAFFRPEIIKVAVACCALVFSLLVEAHSDAHKDPVRNAYVKSISYGIAIEILDSVSFLSLLFVNESHLIYTFAFENFILGLSSINLMLPAVALYKLSVSGFGVEYPLPLEILYKLLHLFLVNVPYLSVRLYLWQFYSYTDTSIFLVKNIYAIFFLIRSVYPDLKRAFGLCRRPSLDDIISLKELQPPPHRRNRSPPGSLGLGGSPVILNGNGTASMHSLKRKSLDNLTNINSNQPPTENEDEKITRRSVSPENV